jgi:cyclopropane fatty-acyl-phospholipid synthase-like methyltransferase
MINRFSSSYWENIFQDAERQCAYNLAPPEAVVRTVSHYLRARHPRETWGKLRALDIGCGAGATMQWLIEMGIPSDGLDISETAVRLATARVTPWGNVHLGSLLDLPYFFGKEGRRFDIVITANVLQHLSQTDRIAAFAAIQGVLNPGGLACLYEMHVGSSAYIENRQLELPDDPGTILFPQEGYHLQGAGLTHFFSMEEFSVHLIACRHVDCSLLTYKILKEEAERRGCGRNWVFVVCAAIK